MKKKSVALIVTLSMMLSIVGCGSKTEDTSKESQAVVETTESIAAPTVEPTAEPTGAVETPEVTEVPATTETTEVAVAEPKLKVEIVEKIETENIVIASVTNVSDETYGFFPQGEVMAKEDPNFEPGETTYVFDYNVTNEDEIAAKLEQYGLSEKGYGDTVTHMDTFTADQFADAIALAERIWNSNGELYAYCIFNFNDNTFLGENYGDIWVDETTHKLSIGYEEANKIIVLWCELTF